jgi:hypothetical protein
MIFSEDAVDAVLEAGRVEVGDGDIIDAGVGAAVGGAITL